VGGAPAAAQRVSELQRRLVLENERLPLAERADRDAQERLDEARSRALRAEGRLQLEQAARIHIEQNLQSLAQRRERLEGELHALQEPAAAALPAADRRQRPRHSARGAQAT
jgi:hypothetical protein